MGFPGNLFDEQLNWYFYVNDGLPHTLPKASIHWMQMNVEVSKSVYKAPFKPMFSKALMMNRPMQTKLSLVHETVLSSGTNSPRLMSLELGLQCFDAFGWASGRASGP